MKYVFIKAIILFIAINVLEIALLLYGIFYKPDWGLAIFFPALVPVIIAIAFHKNTYSAKLVLSLAIMLSLLAIEIIFSIFFGDDGTLIGMLFFSFIFTLLPFLLYAGIITLLWLSKRRSQK